MKILQGKGIASSSISIEVVSVVSFLKSLKIDNPVVFDVGANIGLYTEALLKLIPGASVFAFEPSTSAQKAFENRFNGHANVHLIPIALGSENKSLNLYSDKNGSGLASLTKRRIEHFGIEMNYVESISCRKLDDWSIEQGIYPDFIKIDVEGHELDVLNGALLGLSKVSVVQFEFGGCNIDTRTFFQDFWYFFAANGFSIYRITSSGVVSILSYSEEDEYFSTTNYLAVKKSKEYSR
jgi:FkbM family methyltransferase